MLLQSSPPRPSGSSALAKENAALKARLQQVETAATEALGELQDAQDELDAHKEARQAAEQQVGCLWAHLGPDSHAARSFACLCS